MPDSGKRRTREALRAVDGPPGARALNGPAATIDLSNRSPEAGRDRVTVGPGEAG